MPTDLQQALRDALKDRYCIVRLVGSGGMAEVYLADDLKHNRQVAVKVLRPELTVHLGRERFLREIQIAARLNHPHILALHDSGDANGHLYYVMPFVENESLLQRLERDGPLPVEEAIRIARDVSSALTYAHSRGVLHRDIKPGNILLSAGQAVVADFGLARAVSEAKTDGDITTEGLTIGTPCYMSPEQARGLEQVDERTDIYSLGCVLYELLTGVPPFAGGSPFAILARHATEEPLSARRLRNEVPEWLDQVVLRALAKRPEDRFASAVAFDAALAPGLDVSSWRRQVRNWRLSGAAGVAIALATFLYFILRPEPDREALAPRIDTTRYAVLPFAGMAGETGAALERLTHDALSGWKGITLVDRFQTQEALSRDVDGVLTPDEARRIARSLGAGRYIRGELTRGGEAWQLRLVLYDAAGRSHEPVGTRTVHLGRDPPLADSLIRDAVDLLLLPLPGQLSRSGIHGGSPVLPARQAFAQGDAALSDWNLRAADSAFARALDRDPGYAQAAVWLALVRAWSNTPTPEWAAIVGQAIQAPDRLPSRDRSIARALGALAVRDYPAACSIWRGLTREEPAGFAGWFGLADCLRRDNAVLRVSRAPDGWRFRTSYHQAILAYRQAFALLPSIHSALRNDGFQRVQDLLYVTGTALRPGFATPPDSRRFYAWAEWAGDTLVFYPLSEAELSNGSTGRLGTRREAVLRQREVFHEIASGWVALAPRSADALEALAVSLELLGNPAALGVLTRARQAASSMAESLRVATSEVWVRLKHALPADPSEMNALRALADTILSHHASADAPGPSMLSGLGSLLGRASLAAQLDVRASEYAVPAPPQALRYDGPALVAFSALGGPQDSVLLIARRVDEAIEALVVPGERDVARTLFLGRAAGLLYPDVVLPSLSTLADVDDDLLRAQVASAAGRREEALVHLSQFLKTLERVAPEERTFDALYPAARLMLHLENPQGAAVLLDASLRALPRMSSRALARPVNAASLVRALALRAELADRAGDREVARRWARCVITLWSHPDPFLQPLVRHMSRLAA